MIESRKSVPQNKLDRLQNPQTQESQRLIANIMFLLATVLGVGVGTVSGAESDSLVTGGVVTSLWVMLATAGRLMWSGLNWLMMQMTAPGEQWRAVADEQRGEITELKEEMNRLLEEHTARQERLSTLHDERERRLQLEITRLRAAVITLWTTSPEQRANMDLNQLLYGSSSPPS